MADEKLVLVERFEELRVGMRVVCKGCVWCDGGEHRGILGVGRDARLTRKDGDVTTEYAFRILGERCHDGGYSNVGRFTVEARAVYRPAADLDMERELAREANPYRGLVIVSVDEMSR